MAEKTEKERNLEYVRKMQILAYGLIFSMFGLAVGFNDEFKAIFKFKDVSQSLVELLLLVAVVLNVLSWIANTNRELGLWEDHLEYVFVKASASMAMLILGIALGVFFVLVVHPNWFCLYHGSFMLVNYWTQFISNEHFERALKKTRGQDIEGKKREILDVLEEYWLRRPQLARITTLMYCSMAAFAISLASEFGASLPFSQRNVEVGVYGLMFVNIMSGQVVIWRWRHIRDKKLLPLVG